MKQPTEQEMIDQLIAWRDEPLVDELRPWVEDGKLGLALKHPLVYDVPLMTPGRANAQLEYKKEKLDEALKEHDWHQVIWLHERPYRCWAFIEYVLGQDEMGVPLSLDWVDQDTRDLAADIWVDSENINQHVDDWTAMFDGTGFLMGSKEEHDEFDAMPDPLRLYRAKIDDGDWSWSLDMGIAKFFAKRFDTRYDIVTGKVKKQHVFGYLSRRGESEVLVRLDAPVQHRRTIRYKDWSRDSD